ncbi:Asp23/Gls24 family envelope stress response protein [Paenibacillus aurantius]|uniref:Asp23/Gls24 family envelope stress response protein n=1 Tax=Paenibacillus aurantius TaxID=2918900 RepID=A0AA96RHR6_9BACL|nr:Asp23/Gls24 family envelope stress response protein [Paenibacillus aurantius]WJH33223.1 Asp23/Gls24 family envelope stress response protein [Paenibacillus sp. CC-CFT747]WNQ13678.1 Asp23/Gls24 family envelope stress response protein [Paenibacillus aurantius]
MPIQVANEKGKINITDEVIAVLAGSAALDCYGLVGMASRKQLKDGIAEILGRDNLGRGVEVRHAPEGIHIDLHIIVSYGTKISEVALNVQNRVKYVLNEVVGLKVDFVNIFVQGVRGAR